MIDLSTSYLGLQLRSPIVASASPLTRDLEFVQRLEASGAGAVVLPSLFEEEILHEEVSLNRSLEAGSEHFAEALDYFPAIDDFADAGDRYIADLERIKASTSLPRSRKNASSRPAKVAWMPSSVRRTAHSTPRHSSRMRRRVSRTSSGLLSMSRWASTMSCPSPWFRSVRCCCRRSSCPSVATSARSKRAISESTS